MTEIHVGATEGVNVSTIDFFSGVTWEDLLDAIEQENITGPIDVLVIGKGVNSGKKKNREVGGSTMHFGDSEELYSKDLIGSRNFASASDSLEIVRDAFALPELPESIVGFVIKVL